MSTFITESIASDKKKFTKTPPKGLSKADKKSWIYARSTLVHPDSYVMGTYTNPHSLGDYRTHIRGVLHALKDYTTKKRKRGSFRLTKGGLTLARGAKNG